MPKDPAEKVASKIEELQAWMLLLDGAENALRAMQRKDVISSEVWCAAMEQLSSGINGVRGAR